MGAKVSEVADRATETSLEQQQRTDGKLRLLEDMAKKALQGARLRMEKDIQVMAHKAKTKPLMTVSFSQSIYIGVGSELTVGQAIKECASEMLSVRKTRVPSGEFDRLEKNGLNFIETLEEKVGDVNNREEFDGLKRVISNLATEARELSMELHKAKQTNERETALQIMEWINARDEMRRELLESSINIRGRVLENIIRSLENPTALGSPEESPVEKIANSVIGTITGFFANKTSAGLNELYDYTVIMDEGVLCRIDFYLFKYAYAGDNGMIVEDNTIVAQFSQKTVLDMEKCEPEVLIYCAGKYSGDHEMFKKNIGETQTELGLIFGTMESIRGYQKRNTVEEATSTRAPSPRDQTQDDLLEHDELDRTLIAAYNHLDRTTEARLQRQSQAAHPDVMASDENALEFAD